MKLRVPIHLVVLLAITLVSGCSITLRIPKYEVRPPERPYYAVAGRKKVDITPAPGYPMGGHGPAGAFSRGYWSRLYARAFFFRDAAGHRLALVSCDLFAIPEGLHDEVARLAAAKVSPDELIICATVLVEAVHDQNGAKRVWAAVWLPTLRSTGSYMFRVETIKTGEPGPVFHCSKPFALQDPPDVAAAVRCPDT